LIKLPRLTAERMAIAGLTVLGVFFTLTSLVLLQVGRSYQSQIANEALRQAEEERGGRVAIRRLTLQRGEGEEEVTIEILPDGTIIKTTKDGKKTAMLGLGQLLSIFGMLTDDDLAALQSGKKYGGGGGTKYILTIETKEGEEIIIEVVVGGEDGDNEVPDEIEEIIEIIEVIEEQVLESTPTPVSQPTPTSGIPQASPQPTPTPVGTITPSPSTLPAYLTTPPFTCEDLTLFKNTSVSNTICSPTAP